MFQAGNNPGMHLATQLIGNYSVHRSKRITQILGHTLLAAVKDKYDTSFFFEDFIERSNFEGLPEATLQNLHIAIYIMYITKCKLQNVR